MSQTDPIIVVGAGHNGLTAGAYLARSGHTVLVLERRNHLGGIAATESIIPGYRFNTGFSNTANYLESAIADLGLEKHGFKQHTSKTALFAARAGGGGFALDSGGRLAAGDFTGSQDSAKVETFVSFFTRMADVFAAMLPLTPPNIKDSLALHDLWPWARVALQVKGLGKREMMEFVRVLPMSARELLDEWFSGEDVRGAFALFSVIGAQLGPLGAGTAANFLYQFTGGFAPAFAAGGTGALSGALAKSIETNGGTIRKGTEVEQVLIDSGKVIGVRTKNGEIIPGSRVISSLDPKTTFDHLVGPANLPIAFNRRLQNIRMRGSTATVHFGLNALPDFGVDAAFLDGWITMCSGLLELERAYDDAKYGRISAKPALLATLPSLQDPSLAPDGHHTMSVTVRYAPFNLREGDYSSLAETVKATIETFAPGFRKLVAGEAVLTPADYAQEYGLSEGAWTHGQFGLDQLLIMRPVPGWSGYNTPVNGLFLCGSGSHPGGGITGAPGANAAREILKKVH